MKTIKERLQQYIDLPIDQEHRKGFEVGFKKGVELAQRFIPVDEELPEIPELSKTVSVIAKLDEGNGFSHLICFFTKSGKFFNVTPRLLPEELCLTVNTGHEDVTEFVVSWRPIEFK